jgi:hypothetical protein
VILCRSADHVNLGRTAVTYQINKLYFSKPDRGASRATFQSSLLSFQREVRVRALSIFSQHSSYRPLPVAGRRPSKPQMGFTLALLEFLISLVGTSRLEKNYLK